MYHEKKQKKDVSLTKNIEKTNHLQKWHWKDAEGRKKFYLQKLAKAKCGAHYFYASVSLVQTAVFFTTAQLNVIF